MIVSLEYMEWLQHLASQPAITVDQPERHAMQSNSVTAGDADIPNRASALLHLMSIAAHGRYILQELEHARSLTASLPQTSTVTQVIRAQGLGNGGAYVTGSQVALQASAADAPQQYEAAVFPAVLPVKNRQEDHI